MEYRKGRDALALKVINQLDESLGEENTNVESEAQRPSEQGTQANEQSSPSITEVERADERGPGVGGG